MHCELLFIASKVQCDVQIYVPSKVLQESKPLLHIHLTIRKAGEEK
jgi:hypothetical protein